MQQRSSTAAFFRVEGTLVGRGAISLAAYCAANQARLSDRVMRLGQLAVAAPIYALLGQSDRVLANRLAYLPLRGMSEDRVAVLAEEYFEQILKERVLKGGLELLKTARSAGRRVVLISDTLEPVVAALVKHLRHVDDFVCNRLELRDGLVTGKLLSPVVGGHDSDAFARDYARDHGLDLARSVAYGAHGPDLLLLSTVGSRCAVNPDFTLRRAAQQAAWPVLDYDV
jgi:putative phosphoserine phosphatase/1-acylglycerol-3-phosphate O-acyltransferase